MSLAWANPLIEKQFASGQGSLKIDACYTHTVQKARLIIFGKNHHSFLLFEAITEDHLYRDCSYFAWASILGEITHVHLKSYCMACMPLSIDSTTQVIPTGMSLQYN